MVQHPDNEDLVECYYRSLDRGAYADLEAILAADFTHHRPDRTIRGREAFVQFMRDDRPRHDTVHRIESTFLAEEGSGHVAAEGRLLSEAGERLFAFVDVFDVDAGTLRSIRTYTR